MEAVTIGDRKFSRPLPDAAFHQRISPGTTHAIRHGLADSQGRIVKMMKTLAAVMVAGLALGTLAPAWDRVEAATYRVPAGTSLNVQLDSKISTEDAKSGDVWGGTVQQNVVSNGRVIIPAGSQVEGVVTRSAQGTHNAKAQLDLSVRRVNVNGEWQAMSADMPTIIAGSKRAKKIGAIAAGAAAGALLGGAVKGRTGAVVGGLVGGGATYGLTRNAFRTMQLKPGTSLTFTTRNSVAVQV
jgi:hypothetical protein